MESDKKTAKDAILKSIIALKNIYNNSMSTYIFRVFMDAKADEIVQIFNGGPQVDTKNLVEILNKISPTNAGKWAKIK
jgi:phosphoribosylaminoimidazole-succinocarboxamide synthase